MDGFLYAVGGDTLVREVMLAGEDDLGV